MATTTDAATARRYREKYPERARATSRRWKAEHPEQNRRHSFDPCSCGRFEKSKRARVCRACRAELYHAENVALQLLWRDGVTIDQLAAMLGCSRKTIIVRVSRLRSQGWDFPRRWDAPRPRARRAYRRAGLGAAPAEDH